MPKIKEGPLVIIRDSQNTIRAMEKLRLKIARLETENRELRKENAFLREGILQRLGVLKQTSKQTKKKPHKEKQKPKVTAGPVARPARKEEEYVDDRLSRLSSAFVSRIARHDPFFYMDDKK